MPALFSFVAPAILVGPLPETMYAFHVGKCEFSAVPERLRQRFREYGIHVRTGDGDATLTETKDLVLPAGKTLALIAVPSAGERGRLLAREILCEAYGFLAIAGQRVPSLAGEAYHVLGRVLGFEGLIPGDQPLDLVKIEPEFRRSNFFTVEDELFRIHAGTEMGERLRSSLRWVGRALHNFDSDLEMTALCRAIEALLRPEEGGDGGLTVDAGLQRAIGWDGWQGLGDHAAPPGNDRTLELPQGCQSVDRAVDRCCRLPRRLCRHARSPGCPPARLN